MDLSGYSIIDCFLDFTQKFYLLASSWTEYYLSKFDDFQDRIINVAYILDTCFDMFTYYWTIGLCLDTALDATCFVVLALLDYCLAYWRHRRRTVFSNLL